MSNKVYFTETTPGTFVRNKNIHIKNNWWANEQNNEIDNFCYNLRDGIANLIDGHNEMLKQNLSNKEFNELQKIVVNKNVVHVVNDINKNLGAAVADKKDVIVECKRKLYDIKTYLKLSMEEMEMLIAKIQMELQKVTNKYKKLKICNNKEESCIVSKF